MSEPLSDDMGERTARAKLRGDSTRKVTRDKEVSLASVWNVWTRYRLTGSWEAKPNEGGRKPTLSKRKLKMVRKAI